MMSFFQKRPKRCHFSQTCQSDVRVCQCVTGGVCLSIDRNSKDRHTLICHRKLMPPKFRFSQHSSGAVLNIDLCVCVTYGTHMCVCVCVRLFVLGGGGGGKGGDVGRVILYRKLTDNVAYTDTHTHTHTHTHYTQTQTHTHAHTHTCVSRRSHTHAGLYLTLHRCCAD